MNKFLLLAASAASICYAPKSLAQAPVLGTSSSFALFSTNGAVSNTGFSHLTGNVGTNNGSSTNFGNVDGVMHDADIATAIAAADLTIAYNQLDAAIPQFFPAPLLGNGQTLFAGTYAIGQSASLSNTLTLDAQGDPNAVFIFQVEGSFSSSAGAQVLLANGALACNVFWKIEGLADFATGTSLKGTIVANNAAIIMNSGVTLEGRALSTTGAITISGATVRTPIGCGSADLNGPVEPALGSVACFTVFSGSGEVTNTGISFVNGDVGTNVGLTTGFQADNVTGTVHANPDIFTAQCAADLSVAYTHLNVLPNDIELLYPAVFGNDLVLTPHTYILNGATVITGELVLNAEDNEDAVFVIKVNGALSTATYAKVILINGAKAENVYWKIDGAVNLNDYAEFKGTLICNNGAMILNTGVAVEGRALSTTGGVSTFGINAMMTPGCDLLATSDFASTMKAVTFSPNPFSSELNITMTDNASEANSEMSLYNALGQIVVKQTLSANTIRINTDLASGIYFYKITNSGKMIQSGKLISK